MKKIKIKNYSFEMFYLEDNINILNKKKNVLKNIINLIGEYKCFVKYSCSNKAFMNYNIVNHSNINKLKKIIEIEKFIGLNKEMFEDRFVVFYFMPKCYKCEEFNLHKHFLGNIFKKYDVKLIIALNDLGTVFIKYNPNYDKQVKNIIEKYNNRQVSE